MTDSFTFDPRVAPEVSDYFRNKGLKPSFNWRDVWGEEHAHAFTVAKAMNADVLLSIRSEIQKSIDEGTTYRDFRKSLEPRLRTLGWWGKKDVVDPLTGEQITAQLGSPRRLRTIYQANMRTARAAGQFARAQRTKGALPYFVYELGPSENHRPRHVARAGTILHVDDPHWDEWMPPNGWGCKCRVRQVSRREADRRGGVSQRPQIERRDYTNPRTGEVSSIPAGIDPGWHTNPGRVRRRTLDRVLADRIEELPEDAAKVAIADMVSDWKFAQVHAGTMRGTVPVAVLPNTLKAILGAATRVVVFSDYTAAKGRREHPEVTREEYARVQEMLEAGTVIQDRDNHLVFIQEQDGKVWRAVVKVTADGSELYLQTFHREDHRAVARTFRRGQLIRE